MPRDHSYLISIESKLSTCDNNKCAIKNECTACNPVHNFIFDLFELHILYIVVIFNVWVKRNRES